MVQVMQVAAQAGQAAAEAAESMRKLVARDEEDKKRKFPKARKVVRMPDSFGSEDHEQDQKGWRDFLRNSKSWLYYADGSFETGLTNVDQNPKDVLDLNAIEAPHKAKSVQLYAILSGLLKGKPLHSLHVLHQQEDRNGLEVYRQLVQTFTPSSRTRTLSLLQALMQFPQFTKDRTFTEQILSLERLRSEYQRCAGQDISDDLALSILVKWLPSATRQHIQLQINEKHTYSDIGTKQTKQLEMSDRFMMKLIVRQLDLQLQELQQCLHLQVFPQLELQVVQLVAIRMPGRSQASLLSCKI